MRRARSRPWKITLALLKVAGMVAVFVVMCWMLR